MIKGLSSIVPIQQVKSDLGSIVLSRIKNLLYLHQGRFTRRPIGHPERSTNKISYTPSWGVTEMGYERKMFDVSSMNLKCATCSVEIKELPFQPADASRPVYCLECNRKRQPDRGGGYRGGSGGRGYGRR